MAIKLTKEKRDKLRGILPVEPDMRYDTEEKALLMMQSYQQAVQERHEKRSIPYYKTSNRSIFYLGQDIITAIENSRVDP